MSNKYRVEGRSMGPPVGINLTPMYALRMSHSRGDKKRGSDIDRFVVCRSFGSSDGATG